MELEQLTIADIARLLAAIKKLKADDATFVQQVIAREETPAGLPHPRVTIGTIFRLLEQTGGSTVLPEDIVALLQPKAEPRLSPEPQSSLVNAIVLEVVNYQSRPEDFEKIGTRVRIRRDSKFAHQNSGEGIVTNIPTTAALDDSVIVRWVNNGDEGHCYRTGRSGECDLELVERPPSLVTIKFADGSTRRMPVPADRVLRLGDLITVDP